MPSVDPSIRSSRVGETVEALFLMYDALRDAGEFPTHPVTGLVPELLLGRDPFNLPEYLTVVTNPDETSNQWTLAGPASREEFFTIDVAIRTLSAGEFDQLVLWRRLRTLTEFAETALYDVDNGRPKRFNVPGLSSMTRAAAIAMGIVQPDGSGWTGASVLRVEFQAIY